MCNCINKINECLSGYNTELDLPVTLTPINHNMQTSQQVIIATCKIDTKQRKGAVVMFASYCPFCGELYPQEIS